MDKHIDQDNLSYLKFTTNKDWNDIQKAAGKKCILINQDWQT